jgi:Flp pilus assembly protein TadD
MSRSRWASAEGCVPVIAVLRGNGKRARFGDHPVRDQVFGAAPSITRLLGVVMASVPVLALAPAALAGSLHHPRSNTQLKQGSSHASNASVPAGRAVSVRLSHRSRLSTITRLSSSMVLAPGSGYSTERGSALVRSLQARLVRAGEAPGPIDGRYGPLTEHAVSRYQAAHGLQIDGIAGPQTFSRLLTQPHPARSHHPLSPQSRPNPASHEPARPPTTTTNKHAKQPTSTPPTSLLVLLALLALVAMVALGSLLVARLYTRRLRASNDRVEQSGEAGGELADRGVVHLEEPARAFDLGALLEELGDLDGAKVAYGRADRLGHAAGASNLGVLLEEQGDLRGAKAAYSRADQRGDPMGAFNLGVLLEEQGDLHGARAAYSRADQHGHAAGASNLGVLLEEQGDLNGAQAAYSRADQRGDPNGAFNLGVLLEEQGDVNGARAAYLRADQDERPDVARMARAALLDLRQGAPAPSSAQPEGGRNGA